MNKYITVIERGCAFQDKEENGIKGKNVKSCGSGCNKLSTYDWLSEYGASTQNELYEIRFKNTRKGFFMNCNNLPIEIGDIVTVESSPGHDIGVVSLKGDMVVKQMRKIGFRHDGTEFKKVYRKVKSYDIEKWQEAIAMEHQTMIDTRRITAELGLNMKIGDVEYQADRLKAIFYYIADERVDFRELIKILADRFKIRVEMKQIGARQEAGRIGGIGSCGRELCCASFISSFVSVTTNSARFQEILLNPQKLAGQCSKLKCCLNYEVDAYVHERKAFPKITEPLETIDGRFYHVKNDIFKKEMSFSSDTHVMANYTTISTDRVKEIIKLNKKGIKVDKLNIEVEAPATVDYKDVIEQESLTRFDSKMGNNRKNNRRGPNSKRNEQGGNDRRERSPRREPRDGDKPRVESTEKREYNNTNNNRRRGRGDNANVSQDNNTPLASSAPQEHKSHEGNVTAASSGTESNSTEGTNVNNNRNRNRRNNGFRRGPRPQGGEDKGGKQ